MSIALLWGAEDVSAVGDYPFAQGVFEDGEGKRHVLRGRMALGNFWDEWEMFCKSVSREDLPRSLELQGRVLRICCGSSGC